MTKTMRLWLLLSLLLISVLFHEAQGIRFKKGVIPHREHNIHVKSNNGVEEVKLCKGKDCSGRIRKLSMIPISSNATISKNSKSEKNKSHSKSVSSSANKKVEGEEGLSVNPSYITGQPQEVPEPNPDIVDVAGMDYSLASRKPPVHN